MKKEDSKWYINDHYHGSVEDNQLGSNWLLVPMSYKDYLPTWLSVVPEQAALCRFPNIISHTNRSMLKNNPRKVLII